jgi:demethylmenaquinone methyltransferase / 2-methoxy-6-polyprenyl-1,4-benzoquinol methylase
VKESENEIRHVYDQSYVRTLFDSIAGRYDLLNHLLSTGIDFVWRRRAIQLLQPLRPKSILDVATGTGDLAIEACRLNPDRIVGIDISLRMLETASKKIGERDLSGIITLEQGTAEKMRYESGTFDAVTCAFGVRNFENLEAGLKEFLRVLRNEGTALILEFSNPKAFLVKQLYSFYSSTVIPMLGWFISGNRSAYKYLPRTVSEFPGGEDFCDILRKTGFKNISYRPMTFGIASIYLATKEE